MSKCRGRFAHCFEGVGDKPVEELVALLLAMVILNFQRVRLETSG